MPRRFLLQPIQGLWQRLPLHRRGAIAAGIPTACLLFSLGVFTWSQQTIRETQKYVDQTTEILQLNEDILVTLVNAETSVRGYRLTGRRKFLDFYENAVTELPKKFQRLQQQTNGQRQQQQRVAQIEAAAQDRLQFLTDGATKPPLSSNSSDQLQVEIALIERGRAQMERFRATITQFKQEQQKELDQRKGMLQYQQDWLTRVLWLSAGVSAVGSGLAIYLFSQLEKELKLRERRLSESKTLIQAITANVVDGILTLTPEGKIETLNLAVLEMFGYAPEALYDQPLAKLLIPPPACDGKTSLWHDPATYSGSRLQTVGFRQDGQDFPIEVTISHISLEERLIVIIRDVTEQQQARVSLQNHATELAQLNAALTTINTTLEARNQELNQFAYIASHDLKAPLRAIANLSEWLEEDLADLLPDENRQQMQLLRGRVHRMEALINGLLAYSRAGRSEAVIEPVNVAELLAEVIDWLNPPSTFQFQIAPNLPTLNTRKLLLRQVFSNLIDNAIKHHPTANGVITITASDQGNAYEFAVADNGNGIDRRYHSKIFVIFQTLEARDTKESTGVGLAIVKKIVEAEGGTIWIDSTVGQGATFYFTWPKSPLGQREAP
jgi:PAS domain S-box-containing protein